MVLRPVKNLRVRAAYKRPKMSFSERYLGYQMDSKVYIIWGNSFWVVEDLSTDPGCLCQDAALLGRPLHMLPRHTFYVYCLEQCVILSTKDLSQPHQLSPYPFHPKRCQGLCYLCMDSHKTLFMVDQKWGANVRTDPSLTRGIFSTHPNLLRFLPRAPDPHQGHLHPQLDCIKATRLTYPSPGLRR
ncbi:17-beta-hydroxysteroid dehydrogenase 14 [Platysternon megacephalum]|uniref:17-beta-hydroxysteroid dehydrogenase 14 n=1 Tax=Platysternon megacephalum TaxID=55544 RepID=A0A4D9DLA3_9SAUR|nr:17-beta-hydroxysteroid dehydrogenase 14 [Platysternon megacephalum]